MKRREKNFKKSITMRMFSGVVAVAVTAMTLFVRADAGELKTPAYISHPINIRLGFFEYEGFYEVDSDGSARGYGYELMNRLSNYMNCEYDYVTYSSDYRDQLDLLKNETVDLITYVNYSAERAEDLRFSDVPIGTSKSYICKKKGNSAIVARDYKTYKDCKVGMVRGNYNNDTFIEYAEKKQIRYTAVYYRTEEAVINALNSGIVDLILSDNIHMSDIEEPLEVYSTDNVYLAARKDDVATMKYVNKALSLLDENETGWRYELANKYFAAEDGGYILTVDEVAYLKYLRGNQIALKFLVNPDRYPYSYIADGEFAGVIPTLIDKVCEELNLSYEIIDVKDRYAYKAAVESKEADIIADFLGDYNFAEEAEYRITNPYMISGNTLVVKEGSAGDIETIALTPDYFERLTNANIDSLYPDVVHKYYDTLEECVKAVRRGEADATLLFHYTTQELMATEYSNEFKFTMPPDSNVQFSFATLYDKGYCLRSIFNKELTLLSKNGTLNTIIENEIRLETTPITFRRLTVDYPWIPYVACLILVAISALTFWGMYNKAKSKRLTKEIKLEEISYHDELTGFRNRRALYRDIYELEKENDMKRRPLGIVYLDVNGLKEVNDKDGHDAGDKLLLNATAIMKRNFSNAYFYRVGGDEFIILSHEHEEAAFEDSIFRLRESWSEEVSASMGYIWMLETKEIDKNIAYADQKMYQEKNLYYQQKGHDRRKTKRNPVDDAIRIAMKEFASNVPGAFILCRANQEILLANDAVIKLCECSDERDFKLLTGNTLKGMVHPDDWEIVCSALADRSADSYIEKEITYRILCKDGIVKYVTDLGKLVHTKQFGDLFYIVLGDASERLIMAT